ncbi:MAG: holo-[acyl-carrier-protein] synthase [Candidatus Mcinerneyibacterium aminivorans]|uniref:Holo-[acyl-carrier-protein] synthase n=1 Tax=Candidatus Mcinerneyibacterium aminivorans TaxID=2703815 RepID=A0A5D0MFV2_9BACT|nr:MAG: holo-[acyl-carrier-protein] synthase [Candidatus Mcinerneyibacterium aminivorans]
MLSTGIDIIEIERIKKTINRYGNKFLNRIYSEKEIDYCHSKSNPYPSYAVRFAAKEAYIKYNEGLNGLNFKDIEIRNNQNGKPLLYIKGKKKKCSISLSHSRKNAVAVVIGGKN